LNLVIFSSHPVVIGHTGFNHPLYPLRRKAFVVFCFVHLFGLQKKKDAQILPLSRHSPAFDLPALSGMALCLF